MWRRGLAGRTAALLAVGVGIALAGPASQASALPADRGYEMVSPEYTQGGNRISLNALTADGSYGILNSAGIFAGTPGMVAAGGSYAVRRTPSGWVTDPINPGAEQFPSYEGGAVADTSPDLRTALWQVRTVAEKNSARASFYTREDDGSGHGTWRRSSPSLLLEGLILAGTSANLDTALLQAYDERPALDDGTVDARLTGPGRGSLYRSSRRVDGTVALEQIAYLGGATMFPKCEANTGGVGTTSRGAVSPDASTVFFSITGATSACKAPAASRAWAWVRGQGVIDLSASRCTTACGAAATATFEGASRDGRRAYFTTTQKLIDADGASADRSNLYEYDFDSPGNELRPVTVGATTAGAGVVRVIRVSEDGSRAYFVASGRALAGQNARGESPQPGASNLYVSHRPPGAAASTITFVGALAAGDASLWGPDLGRQAFAGSASGRFLAFSSRAALTADKLAGDVQPDVYRYDAEADELQRAWSHDAPHNGAARSAGSSVIGSGNAPNQATQLAWEANRSVSDDGNLVYFTTAERLDPADENDAEDAYLWDARTGAVDLISAGRGTTPTEAGSMTPSGSDLTFTSAHPLVAAHTSTALTAYTARVGGGFPDTEAPPLPCVGEACQPPAPGPPPSPDLGSLGLTGLGNLVPPATPPAMQIKLTKPKTVRGTRATVRVAVPGAGRLTASGSGLRQTAKSVARGGTSTIAVRLTKRATATLRRSGRVNAKLRARFRTSDGRTATATVPVSFRSTKKTSKRSSATTANGKRNA